MKNTVEIKEINPKSIRTLPDPRQWGEWRTILTDISLGGEAVLREAERVWLELSPKVQVFLVGMKLHGFKEDEEQMLRSWRDSGLWAYEGIELTSDRVLTKVALDCWEFYRGQFGLAWIDEMWQDPHIEQQITEWKKKWEQEIKEGNLAWWYGKGEYGGEVSRDVFKKIWDREQSIELLRDPRLPLDLAAEFIAQPTKYWSTDVLFSAAVRNPQKLPEEWFDKAVNGTEEARKALAGRTDISDELRQKLRSDGDLEVEEAAYTQGEIGAEVEGLIGHTHIASGLLNREQGQLPSRIMELLARHPINDIRRRLAVRADISKETACILMEDKIDNIRQELLDNNMVASHIKERVLEQPGVDPLMASVVIKSDWSRHAVDRVFDLLVDDTEEREAGEIEWAMKRCFYYLKQEGPSKDQIKKMIKSKHKGVRQLGIQYIGRDVGRESAKSRKI